MQHNAERLLKLIDEVYRWLPLGTIVNNGVLVVHGGISDSTDLDLIRSLDRGKVSMKMNEKLIYSMRKIKCGKTKSKDCSYGRLCFERKYCFNLIYHSKLSIRTHKTEVNLGLASIKNYNKIVRC